MVEFAVGHHPPASVAARLYDDHHRGDEYEGGGESYANRDKSVIHDSTALWRGEIKGFPRSRQIFGGQIQHMRPHAAVLRRFDA